MLEGGKFFPETRAGLTDPWATEDVPNREPPRDGHIASGDVEAHPSHPVPAAAILNEAGRGRWPKHDVSPGETLQVTWSHSPQHKTRRWKAYITKPTWNPELPLTREQFELTQLMGGRELSCRPLWMCSDSLVQKKPYVLNIQLPANYTGYHVLLAIWEMADTSNAIYQVIDLNFR